MELFIVEIARYVIILIFGLYTFYSFRAFVGKNKERQNRVFAVQRTLTVLLHTVMSALLIMEHMTLTYVFCGRHSLCSILCLSKYTRRVIKVFPNSY